MHEVVMKNIGGQKWTATDTVYGTASKPATETWTNGAMTIQTEAWNSDGTVHDIHYYGITGQAYTSYDVLYGANKPVSAVYSNGMTESWGYNSDGSLHDIAIQCITGQKWTSTDTLYGTTGKPVTETWANGTSPVQVETWNGNGTVHDILTYTSTGTSDTFVFVPQFGQEIISA